MTYRETLQLWVREALGKLGGEGSVIEVTKQVWLDHENDIKQSGDRFYTWQYDVRWAAQYLRDTGFAALRKNGAKSVWVLKK